MKKIYLYTYSVNFIFYDNDPMNMISEESHHEYIM